MKTKSLVASLIILILTSSLSYGAIQAAETSPTESGGGSQSPEENPIVSVKENEKACRKQSLENEVDERAKPFVKDILTDPEMAFCNANVACREAAEAFKESYHKPNVDCSYKTDGSYDENKCGNVVLKAHTAGVKAAKMRLISSMKEPTAKDVLGNQMTAIQGTHCLKVWAGTPIQNSDVIRGMAPDQIAQLSKEELEAIGKNYGNILTKPQAFILDQEKANYYGKGIVEKGERVDLSVFRDDVIRGRVAKFVGPERVGISPRPSPGRTPGQEDLPPGDPRDSRLKDLQIAQMEKGLGEPGQFEQMIGGKLLDAIMQQMNKKDDPKAAPETVASKDGVSTPENPQGLVNPHAIEGLIAGKEGCISAKEGSVTAEICKGLLGLTPNGAVKATGPVFVKNDRPVNVATQINDQDTSLGPGAVLAAAPSTSGNTKNVPNSLIKNDVTGVAVLNSEETIPIVSDRISEDVVIGDFKSITNTRYPIRATADRPILYHAWTNVMLKGPPEWPKYQKQGLPKIDLNFGSGSPPKGDVDSINFGRLATNFWKISSEVPSARVDLKAKSSFTSVLFMDGIPKGSSNMAHAWNTEAVTWYTYLIEGKKGYSFLVSNGLVKKPHGNKILASMFGLSPETLSRQQKGLVYSN